MGYHSALRVVISGRKTEDVSGLFGKGYSIPACLVCIDCFFLTYFYAGLSAVMRASLPGEVKQRIKHYLSYPITVIAAHSLIAATNTRSGGSGGFICLEADIHKNRSPPLLLHTHKTPKRKKKNPKKKKEIAVNPESSRYNPPHTNPPGSLLLPMDERL